jgi:methylmalonyl-CoA mutase N-terminal domain/subunit
MDDLDKRHRTWEETTLQPLLKKRPERKERFATPSGVPLPVVALPRAEDLSPDSILQRIGLPGEFPFTRGVHPNTYRGRLWTMRQYSGFGDAESTNARFKTLIARGGTGLSIAFDLPTQMGIDSDDPRAEGEVGKVGVAIDTLEDMERLFADIPLDKVSTSMTINATAPILLAMYVAVAEDRSIDSTALAGTVQNDILKEYVARGTYIFPPGPSLRLVTDVMRFCRDRAPKWNSISVSGYHIREAGSTAVEELAFTLANGRYYVQAAKERGLDPEKIGGRISFFFNSHNGFLEEIAKFRAARRMWAAIMRDEFGVQNPRAQMMRFHTQTAGCTLTAREPNNNVARVAYQALAAVLGGTQSLHTNSRDEALSLPSEESVTSPMRRARPTPSTPSRAPTSSRPLPTAWSRMPGNSWRRSRNSAAPREPSSRDTSRRPSTAAPTSGKSRSKRGTKSWWRSTASRMKRPRSPSRPSGSIRRWATGKPRGSPRSGAGATGRPRSGPWTRWRRPPGGKGT